MMLAKPVRNFELQIAVIRLSSFARRDSRGRLSPQIAFPGCNWLRGAQ